MPVREHVSLAPLTTLRLGGPASRLIDVESEADVVAALCLAEDRQEPFLVLGGGSNVVVGDDGFPGVVAAMGIRGVAVQRDRARVVVDVGAGEDWDAFVARAVDEGWSGIECMSGIPGRVGGTPVQNVGAYGQEVSDTLVSVQAYDRASAEFVTLPAAACALAYRASLFKRVDRWIVTSVRFSLEASRDAAPIRYAELARALSTEEGARPPANVVREAILALRRGKGMVLDPDDPESVSAGSFFVNPVVDASGRARVEACAGERPPSFPTGDGRFKIAAAWLVERAGFARGWTAGRVGVSRKHALALVNRGGATTHELLGVARIIRDGVRARFGVELEPEPVFVGCSWKDSSTGSGPAE
jgi:UDP-N-acetylmuramate dehydrogenase